MKIHLVLAILITSTIFSRSVADEDFDVRQHLATVTRYGAANDANKGSLAPSVIPDGCSAIHLNLVARHGTRSPTTKRIKELDRLAVHLDFLLNDAKTEAGPNNLSLVNIPAWLWGWQSPWKGKQKGGELISEGENELYLLGKRIKEKFLELFNEEYHPDVFSIRATQVPRVSASAVAFGIGLFSGKGNLGPGRHRAFSLISESRGSDILLRFYDTCETYKKYRENQEPAVEKIKEPILDIIALEVGRRYQLSFTKQDIASLWFLCKQEASLLDITNQACSLFNASEVYLLEWTDDLEGFLLNGYGNSVNYRMGIPLLRDVVESIEQAIMANEGNHTPGTFEKARLRFAHAETVAPFTCLLGLFLEGSEFEQIQREEPLNLPPKPPQKRNWRGSTVAPFAGNTMLVLYACLGNNFTETTSSEDHRNRYFVQVLHNEVPVPIPGCGSTDFCPFEVFKEQIVNPHLKHNFESICSIKPESIRTSCLCSRIRASVVACALYWLLLADRFASATLPSAHRYLLHEDARIWRLTQHVSSTVWPLYQALIGGGLGLFMGLFLGALDNPLMQEEMTARQQFIYTAKQMGRRSWGSAKGFAIKGPTLSAA